MLNSLYLSMRQSKNVGYRLRTCFVRLHHKQKSTSKSLSAFQEQDRIIVEHDIEASSKTTFFELGTLRTIFSNEL